MKKEIEYKRLKEIDFLGLFILEPIYDNVKHALSTKGINYCFVEKSNHVLNYRLKNLYGNKILLNAERYFIVRKVLKFIYKDLKNIYKLKQDFIKIKEDYYYGHEEYEKLKKSVACYLFSYEFKKEDQDFCDLMIEKIDKYLLMKKLESKLPEKQIKKEKIKKI